MPAPRVILIAGPNGAGKSTLAPRLLRDRLNVNHYVNADVIARGLSAYSPESVAFSAGRIMLTRLRELAAARASFAFESTLATRSYAPWLRGLLEAGYEFELVFLWLRSPDLAVQRVRERVRSGGHNVPPDVVRRRYERGRRNFLEIYSPIATRWLVLDNSTAERASVIAAGSESDVTVSDQGLWSAFREQAP